jgi:hypothetical protein
MIDRDDHQPHELAALSRIARELAEMVDIDFVRELRDRAEVLRAYHKLRDDSFTAMSAAAEIKCRAERRLGELMRDLPKQRPGEYQRSHDRTVAPSYAARGIDKRQASRWQSIASLPEATFEAHIAQEKAAGRELTTAGVERLAKVEARHRRRRADLSARAAAAASIPAARWEVRPGDCLPLLADIEPGSVRLAFADPPYNLGVDYGGGSKADRLSPEAYLAWSRRWIEATARTLAPDGSFWVLICDEWADYFGVMLREAGLHRRAWITWFESFGVNRPGNFNRCSRHLFYGVKDPRRFTFHEEAVARASDRQAKYNDKRADPGGKTWDDV